MARPITLSITTCLAACALVVGTIPAQETEEQATTETTPPADTSKAAGVWVKLSTPTTGVEAAGTTAGGSFSGITHGVEGTAISGVAGYFSGMTGIEGYGTFRGGYFLDSDGTGVATLGNGHVGGTFSGAFRAVEGTASSGTAAYFNGVTGVEGYGATRGAYFADSDGTGTATLGNGHVGGTFSGASRGIESTAGSGLGGYFSGYDGIEAYGYQNAGYFEGTMYGVQAVSGSGSAGHFTGYTGVEGYGDHNGGYFRGYGAGYGVKALSSSGSAAHFTGFTGIEAYGSVRAGYFEDTNSTGTATLGDGNVGGTFFGSFTGVEGTASGIAGSSIGGKFTGEKGIVSYGALYGGYFEDTTGTGVATLGNGHVGGTFSGATRGLEATATSGIAGHFSGNKGVEGYGSTYGGYFKGHSIGYGVQAVSDSGIAAHFTGFTGIEAYGSTRAGYFEDSNNTGKATLGNGNVGGTFSGATFAVEGTAISGTAGYFSGAKGVEGYGTTHGGYFEDTDNTGTATLASGDIGGSFVGFTRGIEANGSSGIGGHFSGTWGVEGYGYVYGGYFESLGSTGWAEIGAGTTKVNGSGAVSFVQNHPFDRDRVVVYASPEGDEVANYTRGTGRLVEGEAKVELGETFAWVTNPDIGLTAHLTPVGSWSNLYIVEKTTTHIVVRSQGGDPNGVFDYMVYGLRIGFEEVGIVQTKKRDAPIPAMTEHQQMQQVLPDLRRHTAMSRFVEERTKVHGLEPETLDLKRAVELKAAIGTGEERLARNRAGAQREEAGPAGGSISGAREGLVSDVVPDDRTPAADFTDGGDAGFVDTGRPRSTELGLEVPIDGTAESGDVLVAAHDHPGFMRRSVTEHDPAVVGVVARAPDIVLGDAGQHFDAPAAIAVTGIAHCKVDAGYAPIRVGDLLVTSSTPGHAKSELAPLPGTVVGKALEPLESGTGTIRILVMLN